jgi:hypothetical protein
MVLIDERDNNYDQHLLPYVMNDKCYDTFFLSTVLFSPLGLPVEIDISFESE